MMESQRSDLSGVGFASVRGWCKIRLDRKSHENEAEEMQSV